MKNNSSFLVWFIHASPFILKTILLGLLGISLYASYTLLTSDPPGYCAEQKRFLSDEEFIEIAVRNEASGGMMKINGSDASIVSFHAQHPDCCRVYRETQSFIEKILNAYVVEVVMYYEVNEREFNTWPNEGEYYESYTEIGACGRVYGSMGTRTVKEYLPSGFN